MINNIRLTFIGFPLRTPFGAEVKQRRTDSRRRGSFGRWRRQWSQNGQSFVIFYGTASKVCGRR